MRTLHGGALLASAATLLLCAACGSSGGKTAAAASPSGSAGSGRNGFAAYAACLRSHGVNIPTARPSARPSGQAGQRGGGFGGFGEVPQAARDACRSVAPQGQRQGMQQIQAFRSCLGDHGVTLPTPTPGAVRSPGAARTPGARRGMGFLGGLQTSDPKVAKALKICRPLLPTFSPRPSPN
ncbi:hypothetical protein [Actinoallomurus sp. CA-150999]|uniref:hypothetical protein n=1 Tax=Actinoallomurus sp. CA-150999 TaxID=3239887 RepID=UPI003D8AE9F9